MSGTRNQLPNMNSTNISDFSQYLMQERAKTIPINKYDTRLSIRIWLSTFEKQAAVQGITDLDICGIHITHYMPQLIQQWLTSLAPTILQQWDLIKEALINRFGLPEEQDNQRLLKELKRCKKAPKESIRLHATKWEHLLSLITDKYSEDTKINYFIQSLDKPETRLTLIALQVTLKLDTITKVIDQAIQLEVKAKLVEQPELSEELEDDVIPMDVSYYQKQQQFSRNNRNHYQNSKSGPSTPKQQMRAYDKYGNPICDLCQQKHRTVDCNDYKSNKPQYKKPFNKKNHGKQYILIIIGLNTIMYIVWMKYHVIQLMLPQHQLKLLTWPTRGSLIYLVLN